MTISVNLPACVISRMGENQFEIISALIIVLTVPFVLHYVFFRSDKHTTIPSILLLGPCDSGKTSLFTLLTQGQISKTHTSQTSMCFELLSSDIKIESSNKYRSINDPLHQFNQNFSLIDTPGHGKLRYSALQHIKNQQSLRGIIFVVDASRLNPDDDNLRQTADYLYDILLLLKKQTDNSKRMRKVPILIAVNKTDLFNALPTTYVKKNLESEMNKIRVSRSRSLLDSGTATSDNLEDENDEWLGERESATFQFSHMRTFHVPIEVRSGHILGEKLHIDDWLAWIVERL